MTPTQPAATSETFPTPRAGIRWANAATGLLILTACASMTACRAREIQQGSVMASYSRFTLTTDLPDKARVPAVMAAAEETLRNRGYAIKRSESTEEAGSLTAVPPRVNDYPRMVIEVKRKVTGTRVTMTYQPLGDEEVCRSALDSILVKLGL